MKVNFQRTSLILIIFLFLLQGCAATQQRRDVVKTGFLSASEQSMLTKGEKNEALLRYINPDANWRSYNKVMIDSVSVWKDKETQDVSPEDLRTLTDFTYLQIHDALSQDYTIVPQSGPGTMRIQFAITEAEASDPILDTVTSIIPQTRILTGAKGIIVGGKPGFVGTAGGEIRVTDSQTGKILALAVDRRGGTKNLRGMTDKWNDVKDASIYWAGLTRYRLCYLRGGENCVKPEE